MVSVSEAESEVGGVYVTCTPLRGESVPLPVSDHAMPLVLFSRVAVNLIGSPPAVATLLAGLMLNRGSCVMVICAEAVLPAALAVSVAVSVVTSVLGGV